MHSGKPWLLAALVGHFALGANSGGVQARWRPTAPFALEARYQNGSADSDVGRIKTNVFGLRGYWMLNGGRKLSPYIGAEAAYAKSESDRYFYKADGPVGGGFLGLEWRFTKRLAIGVDAGPYVISLRENKTSIKSTDLDFVFNAGLMWYGF